MSWSLQMFHTDNDTQMAAVGVRTKVKKQDFK